MSKPSLIILAVIALVVSGVLFKKSQEAAVYEVPELNPIAKRPIEQTPEASQQVDPTPAPLAPASPPTWTKSTPAPEILNQDEVPDAGLDRLEQQMNQSAIQTFLNLTGLELPASQGASDNGFSKEGLNGVPMGALDFTLPHDVAVRIYVSKLQKLTDFLKPISLVIEQTGMRLQAPQAHSVPGAESAQLIPYASQERKGILVVFSNIGSKAQYAVSIEADATSPRDLRQYLQGLQLNPAKASAAPF